MEKPKLSLQPSEAVMAQSAACIYAAYIAASRVPEGREQEWIERSINEAFQIVRLTEEAVQSDEELG